MKEVPEGLWGPTELEAYSALHDNQWLSPAQQPSDSLLHDLHGNHQTQPRIKIGGTEGRTIWCIEGCTGGASDAKGMHISMQKGGTRGAPLL
eukprot:scaffold65025_cov39-Tisochrysis_lutea.AAC.3